ncbi:hypothetical protein FK178_00290 [Antarcticibacterium arcticum]|uniref:Carboxypeptidase-like regulatory domain-containing protein n=1 Tax=Antarcticibacterium arcticum TaxID=2585771 RepID=A0A5B8YE75_9FLAO|nr:hypothetical protein [Antarcticibacterium arcticum]QED36262.1 hypothetical protein FK178_00290 [Antarcticibacterium arcticum]
MMTKTFLFTALILCFLKGFSQNPVLLEGRILAEELESSTIHIINISRKTGTVNEKEGDFRILVRQGDTLLFSSIQYVNREVEISAEILQKGFLEISLSEDVNVLAEVNLRNTKLTGNLNTDLDNIKVVKDLPLKLSAADINQLKFKEDINDPLKAPEQLAFQQNLVGEGAGSVNILGGIGMITDLLGIKGKEKKPTFKGPVAPMSIQIRERFNDDFFKSSLGIQESKIREFLFFLDDQGISAQMLSDNNKLALIDLLIEQSRIYKETYSLD